MGGIEAAPSLHILSSRWERASDIFSLWSPLRNLWNSQLYCLVLFTIRVLWTEPRVQDRCVQSFNLICELVDPLCITKGNVAVWGTSPAFEVNTISTCILWYSTEQGGIDSLSCHRSWGTGEGDVSLQIWEDIWGPVQASGQRAAF